jgi:hypothetical protein
MFDRTIHPFGSNKWKENKTSLQGVTLEFTIYSGMFFFDVNTL